jgi:hypothetical protein
MKYHFIGWCKEDNHDKVWVLMKLSGNTLAGSYAAVWGRRGKKLSYLVHKDKSSWEMGQLIGKKRRVKHYADIDKAKLATIYPEFEDDLKGIALWAILGL